MTPREEFDMLHALLFRLSLLDVEFGDMFGLALVRARVLRQMAVLATMLCLVLAITPALAHDSWISRQGLRNAAGEWCCGEGDCFTVQPVEAHADGYHLPGGEVVPFSEAQPSPDGQYWRCKRPDGSRRCFFAPPPNS